MQVIDDLIAFQAAENVLTANCDKTEIDMASDHGLVEYDIDCDPPFVYPVPSEKFIHMADDDTLFSGRPVWWQGELMNELRKSSV